MTSFLNIGASVYNALKGISGMKTYPLVADNDAKYPFCVYRRGALQTGYSKDGLHMTIATMEVSIVADKYSKSIELAEKVESSLKGIELQGWRLETTLADASESYDGTAFIQNLSFRILISL